MKLQYVGFPDGHLTELDKAENPLFFALSFILMASGLFLIYLAGFTLWKNSKILFCRTLIFLFLAILIAVGLDVYLISTLENGG